MPVALMDYAYIAVDGGAACMDCFPALDGTVIKVFGAVASLISNIKMILAIPRTKPSQHAS